MNSTLAKSLLRGVAAFGVVLGSSLLANSAQAFVFQNGSTLNWGDSTNDFYSDVNLDVPNDTLEIIFNPTNFGSDIIINTQTESFDGGFSNGDNLAVSPISADFTLNDVGRYVLDNDIVFNFGQRTLEPYQGADETGLLTWTAPSGTQFVPAFQNEGNVVQLNLCQDTCTTVPYFTFDGQVYDEAVIMDVFQDTIQNTFQFQDASTPANGSYIVGGVVFSEEPPDPGDDPTVPEPSSILGILSIGGLGLIARRKKPNVD